MIRWGQQFPQLLAVPPLERYREVRDLVFPLGQHFPNWENKKGVQEANVKRHSNSKKPGSLDSEGRRNETMGLEW